MNKKIEKYVYSKFDYIKMNPHCYFSLKCIR